MNEKGREFAKKVGPRSSAGPYNRDNRETTPGSIKKEYGLTLKKGKKSKR